MTQEDHGGLAGSVFFLKEKKEKSSLIFYKVFFSHELGNVVPILEVTLRKSIIENKSVL